MATPVVTDQWAGKLECTGPCQRTRLTADAFSKAALLRYYRQEVVGVDSPLILRCQQCVAAAAQREREQAAARHSNNASSSSPTTDGVETTTTTTRRVCAACLVDKDVVEYNKNQWNKGVGVGRCRACVEQAVADETSAIARANAERLARAEEAVAAAQASGSVLALLKAESVLSALQAEKVTGLKPVRTTRGGGGGHGRGRGRVGGGARGRGGKR